jgi:hypothetical protein
MKLLRIISVGFNITDHVLIRFSAFVRSWQKNGIGLAQDGYRWRALVNTVMNLRVP